MNQIDNSIFDGPKTVHVYSTLSNSQNFPVYDRDPQGNAIVTAYVHINGGAHVADRRIETRVGVLTPITERALEHLLQCYVFQHHVKEGRITYRRDQVDIERAVADHTSEKDPSAPITPNDYVADVERSLEDPEEVVALPESMKPDSMQKRGKPDSMQKRGKRR